MTRFWEDKPLHALSKAEWESLCDGCGKCCLHKLEDEDTGIIYYTNIACRLLDTNTCRCKDYSRRNILIRDCVVLDPKDTDTLQTMPASCAYRLLFEGKPLPGWHPLVTGEPLAVHDGQHTICGRVVEEESVQDYEEHIVDWPLEYS